MRQRLCAWTWRLALLVAFALGISGCDAGQDPIAVVAAAVVTGPAPFDAAFDLSYTRHPLGRPMTFDLDFGDGSPSQSGSEFDVAVHHTYAVAGTFQALLSVTDDRGAMAVDTVEITVSDAGPPVGLLVGETAPDFTAHTTDGGAVTLSTLRGSVVLLDFWGAWCPPCRASLPHLDSLVRTYGSRGLVAVIVSTDLKEHDAIAFLEEGEFARFVSVWEPGGKSGNPIAQLYGVSTNDVGIPRTYVIDRQGVIRFVGHPTDLSRDMVEAVL
jgi:peroxiredoxin